MKLFIFSLLFTVTNIANAAGQWQTINGETFAIPDSGSVHLVFIDIWASYGDAGPETAIAALPDSFKKSVQTVWIQPRLNVTDDQVREYQNTFPESKPLIVDDYLRIMRQYEVNATPTHVLLKNGAVVFKGDTAAFLSHLGVVPKAQAPAEVTPESKPELNEAAPVIPSVEDIANLDAVLFAAGAIVNLIFLDDLCPMPHFPQCEETVQAISRSYNANKDNWIVVYNSLYSDQYSAQQFTEKFSLKMPAIFDEKQALYKRYRVHSTPYLIQLDQRGKVLYRGNDFSRISTDNRQAYGGGN